MGDQPRSALRLQRNCNAIDANGNIAFARGRKCLAQQPMGEVLAGYATPLVAQRGAARQLVA